MLWNEIRFMCSRISNQEIVLWIGRFPAFMVPESALTLGFTLRSKTPFSHVDGNIPNFSIQFFDVCREFF